MKVIYRPACVLLADSISKLKEFNTIEEMLCYIIEEYDNAFNVEDIYIRYYDYDNRIKWLTYTVCIGRFGETDYMEEYHCPQAIGYCSFNNDRYIKVKAICKNI